MTTLDPISKLAKLAASRTVRTDRLCESVQAILAKLESHVEIGASVRVDKYTLSRHATRSNIGYLDTWLFAEDQCGNDPYNSVYACNLDRSVDSSGYIHGDFSAPYNGPSRADLIAFATRAPQFVAAFIEREERIAASLDVAESAVST
jgi:hypothetical protein